MKNIVVVIMPLWNRKQRQDESMENLYCAITEIAVKFKMETIVNFFSFTRTTAKLKEKCLRKQFAHNAAFISQKIKKK